jgi:hypothetical protein
LLYFEFLGRNNATAKKTKTKQNSTKFLQQEPQTPQTKKRKKKKKTTRTPTKTMHKAMLRLESLRLKIGGRLEVLAGKLIGREDLEERGRRKLDEAKRVKRDAKYEEEERIEEEKNR